jgi:hypothetical protein
VVLSAYVQRLATGFVRDEIRVRATSIDVLDAAVG